MYNATNIYNRYASCNEKNWQTQNQEPQDIKQSNNEIREMDLMKDIIYELECSLNNEY